MPDNTNTIEKMDQMFSKLSRKYHDFTGIQALVYSEKHHLEYRYLPSGSEKPYQIASVGKVFTAVLVCMLIEEGLITPEDPISRYLPPHMLHKLFVFGGQDHAQEVTVMHLLGHTSGCEDFFVGKVTRGKSFVEEILAKPDQMWIPDMTLEFCRERQVAVGKPGSTFCYTDTGYTLLGKLIEAVTQESFHSNLHRRIFSPLGMKDTYLMFQSLPENTPGHPIEKIWVGGQEVSTYKSLSCDWAGGGIVSTLSDLFVFQQALHEGKLLKTSTVQWMGESRQKVRTGMRYGLGMMSIHFKEMLFLLKGLPVLTGHTGFFTTHMYCDPISKIHVILNFGHDKAMNSSFNAMIRIMTLLK